MKLNIGCGKRKLAGYIGIDAVARDNVDIVAPAHQLPLDPECADEILAVHVWEHFYLWECGAVITEWRRVLKPKGRLVLELPDLLKACRNLLDNRRIENKDPNQLTMWAIYGDPTTGDPYMNHRWGWTPKTLSEFLAEHRFTDIKLATTQFHPAGREHRDMRIEATKG